MVDALDISSAVVIGCDVAQVARKRTFSDAGIRMGSGAWGLRVAAIRLPIMDKGCAEMGDRDMNRLFTFTRQLGLAVGCTAIGAAVSLSAGCGHSSKESPSTTSKPAPSPTEKGAIEIPKQAFNPNMNAADGMLALESEGYIVQLNSGGGYTGDRPLSACKILSVDGLRGDTPPANTTVYLTVSCPNSNN